MTTFLTAAWRNLLMANYSVDPSILQPYLPRHTELDDLSPTACTGKSIYICHETPMGAGRMAAPPSSYLMAEGSGISVLKAGDHFCNNLVINDSSPQRSDK